MLIIICLWFLSLLVTSFERERESLFAVQLMDQLSLSQLSYELEGSRKRGPVAKIWPHKPTHFSSGHQSWEGNIKHFYDISTRLVQ